MPRIFDGLGACSVIPFKGACALKRGAPLSGVIGYFNDPWLHAKFQKKTNERSLRYLKTDTRTHRRTHGQGRLLRTPSTKPEVQNKDQIHQFTQKKSLGTDQGTRVVYHYLFTQSQMNYHNQAGSYRVGNAFYLSQCFTRIQKIISQILMLGTFWPCFKWLEI